MGDYNMISGITFMMVVTWVIDHNMMGSDAMINGNNLV